MIDGLVGYIATRLESQPNFPYTLHVEATSTLLVYATRREQDGDPRLLTAFLGAAKYSPQSSGWAHDIGAVVSELLEEESSNLQKRAAVLAAPLMPESWKRRGDKGEFINGWLSAVDRVKEMDGVTEGVIRISFDMALDSEWRPHMTPEVWALLKRRDQTWPLCWRGHPSVADTSSIEAILAVRSLGDIETLTSFLILVWSGLDAVPSGLIDQMCAALWEEYGIGKDAYREELLRCLDRILEHLNRTQLGLTQMDQSRYPDPRRFIYYRESTRYSEDSIRDRDSTRSGSESRIRDRDSTRSYSEGFIRDKVSTRSDSEHHIRDRVSTRLYSEGFIRGRDSTRSDSERRVRDRYSTRSGSERRIRDRDSTRSDSEGFIRDKDSTRSDSERHIRDRDPTSSYSEGFVRDRDSTRSYSEGFIRDKDSTRSDSEHHIRDRVSTRSYSEGFIRGRDSTGSDSGRRVRDRCSAGSGSGRRIRDRDLTRSYSEGFARDRDSTRSGSERRIRDRDSTRSYSRSYARSYSEHRIRDGDSIHHERRLAAYVRLRKVLLDVERAAAVARIGRWSRTSRSRLYRLKLYRPPHGPRPTLYVLPAIAVAVVLCIQFTQLCDRCPSGYPPWAAPEYLSCIFLSNRIRGIILADVDPSLLVSCSVLFLAHLPPCLDLAYLDPVGFGIMYGLWYPVVM
jgi:hypothetical protein